MEKKSGNSIYYIVSTVLILLGVFVANLFLLLLPMALITLAGISGKWQAALLAVIAAIVFGLAYGLIAGAVLGLCLLIVVLIMAYVVENRLSFYMSVFTSCLLMVLCLVLVLIVNYALTGVTLADGIKDSLNRTYEQNSGVLAQVYNAMYGGDMTAEQALSMMTATVNQAVQPMLLMLGTGLVLIFGLVNYTLPHTLLKKRGAKVGRAPAFGMYSLPRYFGIISAVMLLTVMAGQSVAPEMFSLAGYIIMTFLYIVYLVQGLALLEWWMSSQIQSTGGRVLIYIVVTVFLSPLLTIAGVVEQAIKIRKRRQAG